MEAALNKQVNEEMYSSYFYLAMVSYFEKLNLKGFAHWFRTQVQEEMFHGMKIYNYLLTRGGSPALEAINKPTMQDWKSPLEVFEDALKHENFITDCIDKLMDLAIEEKDHASRNFLNWYVDEQVEEEENFTELVEKLRMIGDNNAPLLMLDAELGGRQPGTDPFFPAPAAE